MTVANRSKDPASRRTRRLSIAGDGLPERIRSTIVAMLGVAAAAGLGLVLMFSRVDTSVLLLFPLPEPPAADRTLSDGAGRAASVTGGLAAISGPTGGPTSAALTEPPLEAPGAVEGGRPDAILVRSALGGVHVAAGNGGSTGGPGSPQGNSGPPTDLPGEAPSDTESEPAPTPVSGSNSSSGLFVRKSVVKDPGEMVEVSEGSPLPNPEPEPEPPAEPAPETVPPPPASPAEPTPEAEAPAGPESSPGSEEASPAA